MKEAIDAIVKGVKKVADRAGGSDATTDTNESRAASLRQLSETLVNLDRLDNDKVDNG